MQIAAAALYYEGCQMLLEAGADSNSIGNPSGVEWKGGIFLARSNILQDISSLQICEKPGRLISGSYEVTPAEVETMKKMKALLLRHGARSFSKDRDIAIR